MPARPSPHSKTIRLGPQPGVMTECMQGNLTSSLTSQSLHLAEPPAATVVMPTGLTVPRSPSSPVGVNPWLAWHAITFRLDRRRREMIGRTAAR